MKAAVCNEYGNPAVIKIQEVNKPAPSEFEVLIKIKASAINSADVRLRKADPFAVRLFFGLFRPKFSVLGGVFSGVIENVGSKVTKFKIGDEVYGSCSLKSGFGAYAEYKCLTEDAVIAKKPNTISFQEAASIPFGGLTAAYFLENLQLTGGMKALVIGVSGNVGNSFVQMLKAKNIDVTGVFHSSKMNKLGEFNLDKYICYDQVNIETIDEKYDIIINTSTNYCFLNLHRRLNKSGKLILVSGGLKELLISPIVNLFSKKKIITGMIKEKQENLEYISSLISSNKFHTKIDKVFELENIVQANEYVESGTKFGSVVVSIS